MLCADLTRLVENLNQYRGVMYSVTDILIKSYGANI